MNKNFWPIVSFVFSTLNFSAVAHESSIVEYSGFGRLIAGKVLSDDAELEGYGQAVSLTKNSLFGLQLDANISDNLSATAQLLAHSNRNRSSLGWLYLNYQLGDSWQFKVGKLHTPFFHYSDVLDVGYAYHWVSPPDEIYSSYFFRQFEGGLAEYEWLGEDITVSFQGFLGKVDQNIQVNKSVYRAQSDVYKGAAINLSFLDFVVRVSQTKGDYRIVENELTPLIDGFSIAGQTNPLFTDLAQKLTIDGDIKFNQFSFHYPMLEHFFQFEFIKVDHNIEALSLLKAYYLTLGKHINQYTFHFTYSRRHAGYLAGLDKLELTTGDAQLDFAISSYNEFLQTRPDADAKSITLGMRYDVAPKVALKIDLRKTWGQPFIGLPSAVQLTFDGSALLMLGGVEWVF
ncbi:hypothetical protein DS2_00725 [Catenovulum agarivorans DS-2]|uniref:Porin domain-containing protein n=1 Tax=Catenovulum agarivorans DS-2 TaxID=1328313 RepID=W7R3J8_9ALTE|nr:hypothetical protein [Catenovulum agarivorans]EWH12200.1 hypothetical protein DS2_00725 [Catenovulum agarivorans DS-2]